jgi:hypothetical protein
MALYQDGHNQVIIIFFLFSKLCHELVESIRVDEEKIDSDEELLKVKKSPKLLFHGTVISLITARLGLVSLKNAGAIQPP